MIFDAVEQAYTVVSANFTADLTVLAAAKGVTVTATATIIKRQDADTFVALKASLPAIGIYAIRAATQAQVQGIRDVDSSIVFDYYATDSDPVKLAKQTELAAEALLRSVDRLAGTGTVWGAGEAEDSIVIELTKGFDDVANANYGRQAKVTVPVSDRDSGL